MAQAYEAIDYARMQRFVKQYFDKMHVRQFFSGNILKDQSAKIGKRVLQQLSIANTVEKGDLFESQLAKLPLSNPIVFKELNGHAEDKNNGIYNYYQVLTDDPNKEKAIVLFLDNLVQVQSFAYLRETHNLGYIVTSHMGDTNGVLSVGIYVQGHEKTPTQMDAYIEDFNLFFLSYLQDLPTSTFSQRFK